MPQDPTNNCKQSTQRPLRAQTINFVVDFVSLLVLLAIAATGLVLKYVLPPGIRGGRGLRLWDLSRHDWGDIHFWLSVTLAGLVVVHVALHWTWVCAVVARWFRSQAGNASKLSAGRRTAYGGAFLLVVAALLFGSLWLAAANTSGSDDGFHRGGRRAYRGGRTSAVLRGPNHQTAQAPAYEAGSSIFR
jgi:hypothetical protein